MTGEGSISKTGFASKIKVAGPKFDKFSVDKVEIASAGVVKAETTFSGIMDGVDAAFKLTDGTAASGTATSTTIGVTYSGDAATVVGECDVTGGPSASVNALVSFGDAVVGADAKLKPTELSKGLGAFSAYDFLVGYTKGSFTGGVSVTKKLGNVSIQGIQKGAEGSIVCKSDIKIGAAKKDAKDAAAKFMDSVSISLGASRKIDDSLSVFAAVDNAGIVRLAAKNSLSKSTSLLLSADLDTTAIGRDVHTGSTKLSFSS